MTSISLPTGLRTIKSLTVGFTPLRLRYSTLVLTLLLGAGLQVAPTHAASEPHEFRVKAVLQGELDPGDLGSVPVDTWVYQMSAHFPHDLRILDEAGKEWPFFLQVPEKTKELWVEVELRNHTWVTPVNEGDFLEFDVVLPATSMEGELHDGIEIVTSGNRFLRRVELCVPGQAHASFGMGYLVADAGADTITSSRIDYGISDLQRFRVRVHSSAHQARERFELTSVRVRKPVSALQRVQWQRLEGAVFEPDSSDTVADTQVQVFDLGHAQVAVERLHFEVVDSAFERSVTVWGRNAGTELWRWLHSDAIYRKPGALKLDVNLPGHRTAFRFLKVGELYHDDAPLTIDGIELLTRQRRIVFEVASAAPAHLYVGNPSLTRARYDLANRVSAERVAAAVEVRAVVDQADLQSGLKRSFLQRNGNWLAALVTAFAALVVLCIILSMTRRMELTSPGPEISDDDVDE